MDVITCNFCFAVFDRCDLHDCRPGSRYSYFDGNDKHPYEYKMCPSCDVWQWIQVRRVYCSRSCSKRGKLNPSKNRQVRVDDDSLMLFCPDCGKMVSSSMFSRNRSTPSGYGVYCKLCSGKRSKDSRKRLYGGSAGYVRLMNYGISVEDAERIIEDLGGKCPICGREFKKEPHVDHDHSCCASTPTCGKCTRGIICSSCNHGLGFFSDDPEVIDRAAEYLRTYISKRAGGK